MQYILLAKEFLEIPAGGGSIRKGKLPYHNGLNSPIKFIE